MVSVVLPFDMSQLFASADASSISVAAAAFFATILAYKLLFPSVPAHERFAAKHGLTNVKPARRLPNTTTFLGDAGELGKNAHRFVDWMLEKTIECNQEPWLRHIPAIPDMILVSTPELIEDVTKTQNDVFPKGEGQRVTFHDLVGDGFVTQDGAEWARQRKTAMKFFSARMFRDVATGMINRHAGMLMDVLEKAVESKEELNLTKLFHEFALQSIAELGFGLKMQLIDSKDGHPLDNALGGAFPQILRRSQLPMWFWKLQRYLNIGSEKEYKEITQSIRSQVAEVVTQSLAQSHEKKREVAATVVELFISAMQDGEGEFTPELLRDIAIVFIIGGRDTTADTANWMFWLLSQNPEVEEKIRAELWEKVPDLMEGKVSAIDYEQSQGLIYMEAAIKETLRLYPPVPLNSRQAACDTVLVDGTFVPKDTAVGMSAYVMGRLPSLWGEDVLEFKPERFIDEATGKLATISSYKFFSFHAGPRVCVGMNLALLELKLLTSSLLSRYRLDTAPNDGSYEFSATLPLKSPLMVRVRPAKAAAN